MAANVTSVEAAYYPDLASGLELLGQRERDKIAVAEAVGIASLRQIGTIGQARAEGFVDGEVGRQDHRFAVFEQRSQGDRGIASYVVNPGEGGGNALHPHEIRIVESGGEAIPP